MAPISSELRELVEAGPLVHLATIDEDGAPQVTMIWVGLDGEELVSGHLGHYRKLRNIERDPRVVLSFDAPRDREAVMNPYAVLTATARVEPSEEAWDLLDRLIKVYMSPQDEFPAPRKSGYIVRYEIEKIGGVGPWAD